MMRYSRPGLGRHLAAAFVAVLACVIFLYAGVQALRAFENGTLRGYLPSGIAYAIAFMLLCWSTRPLIGQPLFGARGR